MVLLDSSSKGKSRRRLFYGAPDSVLTSSSSFGMIFDDEVVGKLYRRTVLGLTVYCDLPALLEREIYMFLWDQDRRDEGERQFFDFASFSTAQMKGGFQTWSLRHKSCRSVPSLSAKAGG